MKNITLKAALNEALREEMLKDDKIIVFGEDVAEHGGVFRVTEGLLEEFGPERVKNTPISEVAIIGAGIGSAAAGLRPVVELMFDDFAMVAGDQIINQMAKLTYMSGGQVKLPIVVRMPMGAGLSSAAQHGQTLLGLFLNVPGLKIVCPSTPYDAKGLLKTAILDNNPVLFFEHVKLYDVEGPIPDEEYYIPFGKAEIKKEGKDLTIIAISEMVHKSINAAEKMKARGIDIEVIDPRTLEPLDVNTIIESVKKTGKVIVAYNGPLRNGAGCEIISVICENAIEFLDGPILRVGEKNTPVPFSPVLEKYIVPQESDIIEAVEKLI